MSLAIFLALLSGFSIVSGLITQGIKKLIKEKENLSYNIIALIVSLIVGVAGCAIYYQFNRLPFDTNNIIIMILMGFASGLCSMLGYDKVKQTILQIKTTKPVVIEESTEE